jgi:hypothetical protein
VTGEQKKQALALKLWREWSTGIMTNVTIGLNYKPKLFDSIPLLCIVIYVAKTQIFAIALHHPKDDCDCWQDGCFCSSWWFSFGLLFGIGFDVRWNDD